MRSVKHAAMICFLAALFLCSAGCGGENTTNTVTSNPPESTVSENDAAPQTSERTTSSQAETEETTGTEEAAAETGTEPASEPASVLVFDHPDMEPDLPLTPADSNAEESASVAPEAAVAFQGNLEFQAYVYGADPSYHICQWPGRVCKTREQLTDLITQLEQAAPSCARMLETCDHDFFNQKAILFAAKESSGVYGGDVHAAVREENAITIYADRIVGYGLPGPTRYDELYFLAVDTRLVSGDDSVTACYKERDWTAAALGDGKRVGEGDLVLSINIHPYGPNGSEVCKAILDPERLGSGIFRSQQELDDWLQAINTDTIVNIPAEEILLTEKIENMRIDFDTTGLVVYVSEGVSHYLGAAADGQTIRLGYRRSGGGCMPDMSLYITLLEVNLEDLNGVQRVESKVV